MTNYNANYPTGVYVIHCEVCETINQLVIIAIIAGIRTFTTISIQNYWYGSHCFAGNNGVLARTRLARINVWNIHWGRKFSSVERIIYNP